MKRYQVCWTILCSLAVLPVVGSVAMGQLLAQGDVTITVTSQAVDEADCPDCPPGTTERTKICYTITIDQAAEYGDPNANDGAKDFHIGTSDGFANNYVCPTAEKFVNGQWVPLGWVFAYDNQIEGGVRKHYISWHDPRPAPDHEIMSRGATFRLCFVYCGGSENLTNSYSWILTTDGTVLPAVPDDDGNRSDVPNSPNVQGEPDDPGWSGKNTAGAGAKVGFALGACILPNGECVDDTWVEECGMAEGDYLGDGSSCAPETIPTVGEWGMIIMALLLLTAGTIVLARRNKEALSAP